ncbi:small ubiquitin-related modifier 3 [Sarcophilus harrisii]|uniref:small ubiquitin-related modifier 3 n=1 Tax=Sarcophilus harrisii TaxID=9305 RepID=UPI001301C61E|nr:small ubiquitin-related modifier 3 [Sarcophilus harrisii]
MAILVPFSWASAPQHRGPQSWLRLCSESVCRILSGSLKGRLPQSLLCHPSCLRVVVTVWRDRASDGLVTSLRPLNLGRRVPAGGPGRDQQKLPAGHGGGGQSHGGDGALGKLRRGWGVGHERERDPDFRKAQGPVFVGGHCGPLGHTGGILGRHCFSTFSPQEGVKTENDHINLKVAGQDGSVVQFKIKRHTPLNKLMKAYCERQGLSMRQIRFRFDGQPINETDTPAQLEMEDEDTIDVFQQQTGGAW